MSGDQIITSLMESDLLSTEMERSEIARMLVQPKPIQVVANGIEIQSNLNPNAVEFFPSYLQKPTHISNEMVVIAENVKGVTAPKVKNLLLQNKLKEVDNETVSKDAQQKGHGDNSMQDACPKIISVSAEEKRESNENKLKLDVGTNELYVIFTRPFNVKKSNSNNSVSISPPVEIKNSLIENKKQKKGTPNAEIAKQSNHSDTKHANEFEKNIVIGAENIQKLNKLHSTRTVLHTEIYNINKSTNETIERSHENNTKLSEDHECERQASTSSLVCKHNKKKVEGIDETKEANTEIRLSGNQLKNKDLGNGRNSKNKLNINSKITKETSIQPGTGLKCSLAKTQNLHPKSGIKSKVETMVVKNVGTDKRPTSDLAKNRNANSNHNSSNPNEHSVRAFNKKSAPASNTVTTSKMSTIPIKKSSLSSKSCPQSGRVKSTEKSVRLDLKVKECIPSPRATVSSKLRKSETRKRRNLFFDLDTIKMSDFLFK